MKRILFIITFFVILLSEASAFDLEKGISKNSQNINVFKQIYFTFKTLPGYIFEYDQNKYYSLSKTGSAVGEYNFAITPPTNRGWSLTRWPHLKPPIEITNNLYNFSIKAFKSNIAHVPNRRTAGCLAQTPLRYGDIEVDGKSELVLFLNGELIIFSPEYRRTVFSTFWQADDWERETTEYNSKPSPESKHIYQFASAALALKDLPYKAMRSYSKIYVGKFDQDDTPDIIVWQKVYESNTSEEAPGFKLLRSSYQHFERDLIAQEQSEAGVTGEYLSQETEPATIQNWLSAKQLTWQKGYPSTSECPGQENQLIPEMHDPLLNDPDVLK